MYCAPTHPAPQKIILGTLLNDTAFFKERNLAKYLHTEFAHIPDCKPGVLFFKIGENSNNCIENDFKWSVFEKKNLD